MKRAYSYLALLLLMVACATTVPETPAQIINESEALILTVKTRIHENLVDRVWTPQKALSLLDQVEAAERDVDAAKALLDAGKGVEAAGKAGAARTVLRNLRKQVDG